MTPFYETDRALAEYLLFHYGAPEELLPYPEGPAQALGFPARCVSRCIAVDDLPNAPRALDLGCAVGRATFELARHSAEVVGIDASCKFIEVAETLRRTGTYDFQYPDEGRLFRSATARVPDNIDRDRVRFRVGDAENLEASLGRFDLILLANLIDRLPHPRKCLEGLAALARPGAQLILTSPYTWLTDYTPVENWIGGYRENGVPVPTLDGLRRILQPRFELTGRHDLPFLIREHARKYQWSVAEASLWRRCAG